MDFAPLLENPYDQTLLFNLMIANAVVLIIMGIISLSLLSRKPKVSHWLLMAAIPGMFASVGLSALIQYSDGITRHNHQIAEANLAQKYQVDKVFWYTHKTNPLSTESTRIAFSAENRRYVTVSYKIDPVTSEPFLMDEPDGVRAWAETRVSELVRP